MVLGTERAYIPEATMSTATKTTIMTGASRGLGKEAAITMLRADPSLHLVVLSRSAGDGVAEALRTESRNSNVTTVQADLASLGSIRSAAATISAQNDGGALPPLTGFVGNAGLQLLRATDTTVDGLEATFAVNVLANYVLIDAMQGHFTAPARIVITTSDTHFGDFIHNMGMVPAPVWRNPRELTQPGTANKPASAVAGRTAYSTSKLAVIYLAHALARRLPEGIDIFTFNPGLVPGTGLVRDSGPVARFAFRRIMPLMTATPWARTLTASGSDLANAAIGPIDAPSGSYLNGAEVEQSSPESYNADREEALWAVLTRLSSTQSTPTLSG